MILDLSQGELYEVNDAIVETLERYLQTGDPEFYEARQGTVSNLLGALKKLGDAGHMPQNPELMFKLQARVTALRDSQRRNPAARAAVQQDPALDYMSDRDGIRDFVC